MRKVKITFLLYQHVKKELITLSLVSKGAGNGSPLPEASNQVGSRMPVPKGFQSSWFDITDSDNITT